MIVIGFNWLMLKWRDLNVNLIKRIYVNEWFLLIINSSINLDELVINMVPSKSVTNTGIDGKDLLWMYNMTYLVGLKNLVYEV